MQILWVATKPPWPPTDGGRLLVDGTLRALAAAGARISLVAPVAAAERASLEQAFDGVCEIHPVATRRRGPVAAAVAGWRQRLPWSAARHALPAVRATVDELCHQGRFDIVHAEQLQAFWATGGAAARNLPRVLRAQNVESDLWRQAASTARWARPAMAWESRQLATWEGSAVRAADLTLALTAEDRERLTELAGGGRVEIVTAPFANRLPRADRVLPGDPPIVLFGSAGWLPNRRAGESFVHRVWPLVRQRLPQAELHVFGDSPATNGFTGVSRHPAPQDSKTAFAPGSILVVPLDIASGVRMKILEAWARGIPVVASPAAAKGLRFTAGRELLVATDAAGYAAACERLAREDGLRAAMVQAGRERLRTDHHPARLAARQLELYESLVAASAAGT